MGLGGVWGGEEGTDWWGGFGDGGGGRARRGLERDVVFGVVQVSVIVGVGGFGKGWTTRRFYVSVVLTTYVKGFEDT